MCLDIVKSSIQYDFEGIFRNCINYLPPFSVDILFGVEFDDKIGVTFKIGIHSVREKN